MSHSKMARVLPLVSTLALWGCTSDDPGGASGTETETSGVVSVGETSSEAGSASETSGQQSTTATTTDPSSDGGTETTDPTAGSGGGPVECEPGVVYECGDGIDNDDDGLIDLADPECVGPCDNDEGSFQTGIPGDNVDCFQDCFFDGNSGHEDDQCWWNITCDPANPGEGGLCAYSPSPMCMMTPPYDNDACAENCLPQTPKGCDCFGCCTVIVDGEEVDIWIGSSEDCNSMNIEACTTCTKSDFCSNDCDPDACDVCFGGTLPEGCDEPNCENNMPCTVDANGGSNCAEGYFCLTGCCTPHVPQG